MTMPFPILDATLRDNITIALCLLAILLVLPSALVRRGRLRGWPRYAYALTMALLAAGSVGAYFEWGYLRYNRYMNPHDVFHYYIGAKYSIEHEYTNLYRAALVADRETGAKFRNQSIRNLENHKMESVASVLAQAEAIKRPFAERGRWEEFKRDVAFFRDCMPNSKWSGHTLRDKGYNGSPVWNAIARHLANRCPTTSVWGMRLLTYLDLAALAVMFALVWAAFGWSAFLFAAAFHGTNYFMSMVHIKGAFMRLDWVAALVASICLLRMRRYKTAGVAMAYAGMARVFPFIFAFGMGVKLAGNLGRHAMDWWRRAEAPAPIKREYIEFFAALSAACALLFLWSAWDDGGFQLWRAFAAKIGVHNADISTTRAGFKYIFVYGEADRAGYFAQHQLAWRAIVAGVLLLTAWSIRKLEDYETVALSFVPVYFMTAPTFYYYVMLIVPLFLFVPKMHRPIRALGLASFFALSIFAFLYNRRIEQGFDYFYVVSWVLFALCAFLLFAANLPCPAPAHGRRPERETGGGGEPGPPDPEPGPRWSRRDWLAFAGGLAAPVVLGGAALGARAAWRARAAGAARAKTGQAVLAFVGDIMMSRNVERSVRANGGDFTRPFQAAADLVRSADLAFGNLECPISGRGTQIDKRYVFNAPPESVAGLTYAGFDIVSLANNHTLDFGPVALEDTERILREAGVRYIGVANEETPQPAEITEVNGIRIGWLAYADSVPKYSYAREFFQYPRRPANGTRQNLARDIAALRPNVDLLVVSMHWGIEYTEGPSEHTVALGRHIIDLGADIVAGHHPHVQHDAEFYKDRLIIYSMGNFVFDQHSRPATRVSRLYRVTVDRAGIVLADFVPLEIAKDAWQPRPTGQPPVLIARNAAAAPAAPEAAPGSVDDL